MHRTRSNSIIKGPRRLPRQSRAGTIRMALAALLTPVIACAVAAPAAAEPRSDTTPAWATSLVREVTDLTTRLRVPGAIIYVDMPGSGTWRTALGSATFDGTVPMSVANHMRIGSITKTFTAELILRQADAGLLRLDDPVARYRPEVPDGQRITIRQLLDMTSGLYNYTEDADYLAASEREPGRSWTAEEVIAVGLSHPPYFPPGNGFHYSNTNYELLGLIAEQVGGAPLAELMRANVFVPLGLNSTTLPDAGDRTLPVPHPRGYSYGTAEDNRRAYEAYLAGDTAAAEIAVAAGTPPDDVTDVAPDGAASGGGISTVDDLAAWARALGTGAMLSAATQRERLTFDPDSRYGLGIEETVGGMVGHNGVVKGFQSFVGYQRQTGTTVVVLTNLQSAPNTYLPEAGPADRIAALIADRLPAG